MKIYAGNVPLVALLVLISATGAAPEQYTPVKWERFAKVVGQPEPVPEQWLQDEEARFAHNIKLPDVVARPAPFDFTLAAWKSWLPGIPAVGKQYFHHLCDTEAGEWLLKKAPAQAGIYNARPMRRYSTQEAQARYDLEAPALQRSLHNARDDIELGTYFVGEPSLYHFVEEPRRTVGWQSGIEKPYIRMFGYQPDRPPEGLVGKPMQMVGIDRPTARFAFTWRGTKRVRDRENSVSGVEQMVYDRETGEILAVRRQFIYAPPYKGRPESNSWLQGEVCQRLTFNSVGREDVIRLPLFVTPTQKALQWRLPDLISPLPPKPNSN